MKFPFRYSIPCSTLTLIFGRYQLNNVFSIEFDLDGLYVGIEMLDIVCVELAIIYYSPLKIYLDATIILNWKILSYDVSNQHN